VVGSVDDERLLSSAATDQHAQDHPLLGLLGRATVLLLGIVVVGFGVWTLLYQAALAADVPSTPTLLAAVLVTVPVAWLLLRPGPIGGMAVADPTPVPLAIVVVAVSVLAVGLGLAGARPAMMVVLVVGAAAALLLMARRRPPRGAGRPGAAVTGPSGRSGDTALWLTAWGWGLVCAVVSALSARPDGDDAYFLNLTEWVADRGDFPTRDTMVSDEAFPALSGHSPPVHSIEGLIGAVGHLTGRNAGLLTYVVAAPVLSLLAVLALGWLVSLSRIRHAALGLSAAVVFLLASGGNGASYGNFFILRIWQGKATLASLVIPLVFCAAIAYLTHGGWRRQLVFVLAVVCTVGASNTAVFLVPVLVAGVVCAAFVVAGPRRAAGAAVAVAYPILCGLVVIALAPATPEPTEDTGSSAPGLIPLLAVPGDQGVFVATILAVTLGWLGLRSVAARTTVVATVLAAAVALLPPVTELLATSAGVGSVLWRMWWVVPMPLLVAGVVGAVADLVARAPRVARSATVLVAAFSVALVPLAGGRWIWSPDNGSRWVSPLEWKVPVGAEREARVALDVSRPGDVVLAPWDTSRVLSGMSVDVHPVSARSLYLSTYAGSPAAHSAQRAELQRFADSRTPPAESLRPLVEVLSVDTACVGRSRGRAVDALESIGFTVAVRKAGLVCLRR
jgi:hypothetical protein